MPFVIILLVLVYKLGYRAGRRSGHNDPMAPRHANPQPLAGAITQEIRR